MARRKNHISHEDYQRCVAELKDHARRYYVEDAPIVSDTEYDQLYHLVAKYEAQNPLLADPDSPTQTIGVKATVSMSPFVHSTVMASLNNAFTKEAFENFYARLQKQLDTPDPLRFCCEPKMDGLAVAIRYKNGLLDCGGTRGDGNTGETITENLKHIATLPKKLPHPIDLEVRGEVYMRRSVFAKIGAGYANPRNMAAGSLRQLDAHVTAERELDILIYQGFTSHATHSETLSYLKILGFPVSTDLCLSTGKDTTWEQILRLFEKKQNYDFDTDGVVVKLDDLLLQRLAGMTSKAPRWGIAVKLQTQTAQTILEDIQIQVGRTGVLTPVAILTPVSLGGVTIQRATLHNVEDIARKDIKIGDIVEISRAGDVIPEVVCSVRHFSHSKIFTMPETCPICQAAVCQIADEVAYRCSNWHCLQQQQGRILHYASRNAIDIEGLGEKLVATLTSEKLITTPADLYSLTSDILAKQDRMGEKSGQNLYTAIQASKTPPLHRFIFALGIPGVGEQLAKSLADYFQRIEDLANATVETLISRDDIGEKTAQAIARYFQNSPTKEVYTALLVAGVSPSFEKTARTEGSLFGSRFLFTGTLSISRHAAQAKALSHGAELATSVTAQLTHLVVGENPGSKVEKAKKLNTSGKATIQILDEGAFLGIIGE